MNVTIASARLGGEVGFAGQVSRVISLAKLYMTICKKITWTQAIC